MSIGQHNHPPHFELLQKLGLIGVSFHDCKPEEFIGHVWSFSNAIWSDVDLENYTSHDIGHSLRIIDSFLKLNQLYEWSQYEKMLFAAAALIHDIGMQFNVWVPEVKPRKYPMKKLPADEVRRRHIEFGSYLVCGYLKSELSFSLPPPCMHANEGHYDALDAAAHIAFAHSGQTFLQKFIVEGGTWDDRSKEENKYRPRLLAGTLRLCDELDGNYTRLRERQQNRILSWDLSDEIHRHWFSCLFVETTDLVIKDSRMATISLRWRAPRDCEPKDLSKIKILLGTMREAKLRDEIQKISDFYVTCGETQHIRAIVVNPLDPEPRLFRFSLYQNRRFREMLNRAVKQRHKYKRRVVRTLPKPTQAGGNQPLAQPELPVNIPVYGQKSLELALRDWFIRNRQVAHYELVSGEHTDTYLNCRTWFQTCRYCVASQKRFQKPTVIVALTLSWALEPAQSPLLLMLRTCFNVL